MCILDKLLSGFPFRTYSVIILACLGLFQMGHVDRQAVLELLRPKRKMYAALLQYATLQHRGCQQKV